MSGLQWQDSWPDVVVTGYEVRRTGFRHVQELDEVVTWKIFPGLGKRANALVVIGDLTVTDASGFAGVTAVAHVRVRDEPEGEITWDFANDVIERHGLWISFGLYDFMAQAMRSMLSGSSSSIEVPWETPDPEVHFADDDVDEIAPATSEV